ncbi:hypothetical protein ASC94_27710 [Massilia sp. Root418]|jgi:hypothetical protein|uniref:hypothetical protein n=1 Tax=Massilia sp. Root418 TaxID=1736532 RepID=UPI0006FE6EBA|nr:hypothetical protein [Massilia sp. Root418]KQW87196.1 hypothetical protein ASC94_27710 [Massilia sp. Root418]
MPQDPVNDDHILFSQCIEALRSPYPAEPESAPNAAQPAWACLLTEFQLTQTWELGICTILPSVPIQLAPDFKAYLSIVRFPQPRADAHRLGTVLAAIVSFCTGTTCKSPRNDFLTGSAPRTAQDFLKAALAHPVFEPYSSDGKRTEAAQAAYQRKTADLIRQLLAVDDKTYLLAIQAIRLVQLSLSNKRDDFGLGYTLLAAAIESVAQVAIKRDKVKPAEPAHEWDEKARNDPAFAELLRLYREARGQNGYLQARFVAFVLKYAPYEGWSALVQAPLQNFLDVHNEQSPEEDREEDTLVDTTEPQPHELGRAEIESMLKDVYEIRSYYVHRGKQPPHWDPNPGFVRYFHQTYTDDFEELMLPTYALLLEISRQSISTWLAERALRAGPRA